MGNVQRAYKHATLGSFDFTLKLIYYS